jgi:hypothetical protein
VYAFIKEKECSKEEKTRGKNWEVARISLSVSMLVLVVHPRGHQRGQHIHDSFRDLLEGLRADLFC